MIRKFKNNFVEAAIVLFALVFSSPLYLIVVNAFKTNEQIYKYPFALPDFSIGFDNIIQAFDVMDILRAYFVTFSISFISLSYAILFASLAAYAIARINHWFFRSIYWFYVSLIMMPIQAAFIPLIFMLKRFDLYNNIFGISLVYMGLLSSFCIFMYVGFIRGVSIELEEAAKMEGCSMLGIFIRIVFPLLKPVSATLLIFQFVHIWDDLLLPLVLLNSSENPTVTLGLYQFFGNLEMTNLSVMFGGFTLVLVPVIIVFVFFQRYFISGLQGGALKG